MGRFIWTPERFAILTRDYGKRPIKEIAEGLGTTYLKVVDKAKKSGLNSKIISGEIWSQENDQLLSEHFEYAPKRFLLELFPQRTWPAILQRGIKTLKLNRLSQDKYSINYRFFDEWNEYSAYIFGFILADGYLALSRGERRFSTLQIELAAYDVDILQKMKKLMDFEGPIHFSKRDTARIYISNTKIIQALIEKGIPAINKTTEAAFPNVSDEIARHIIRGLLDGDGSVYYDNGMRFSLKGTKILLEKVLEYLPVETDFIPYDNNKHGVNVFSIKFGKKKSTVILDWLYKDANIYLDRKYNKYKDLRS